MTTPQLLKYRLPALFGLLVATELVNLFKLSVAFSWSNPGPLGALAAVALGAFLIGSILATSFDLEDGLRSRLNLMVVALFVVQTALVCVVSFLYSLSLMPAQDIAALIYTPVEATRRVVAVAEGAATNVAAFAYWGVLGTQWRKEIDARRTRLAELQELALGVARDGGGL